MMSQHVAQGGGAGGMVAQGGGAGGMPMSNQGPQARTGGGPMDGGQQSSLTGGQPPGGPGNSSTMFMSGQPQQQVHYFVTIVPIT